MKYSLLFGATLCPLLLLAQASEPMPLYPGVIPNSRPAENLEKTEVNKWGHSFTTATSVPTLTPYRPKTPNGTAVIICPGGGYVGTAGLHEGVQVAEVLQEAGYTVFVLKYRIPNDRYCVDKSLAPLQDAQQAIRTVRRQVQQWNIRPDHIGIMGFSAGGHLASTAATHFDFAADPTQQDTTSVRPDFAVLIYPVISFADSLVHAGSRGFLLGEHPTAEQVKFFSNELQVSAQSPPAFLVHAGDDNVVSVNNSIVYYLACQRHGVPAEMHLYPGGGHGFGMKNPTTDDQWIERLVNWMKRL